jgi:hypothetical protein
MAKTYYGYVERDDKAYVDWASIGKTITDDLIRVGNERTQKREQLETDVTNSLSTFEKLTANQPPIASEYYMTAAENMRNWMLQQQKLMKAGQISVSDFTRKRQVLMDGVEQMAANSKLYNAWLQENMDRLDTSSKREKFIQSEAEKFSTNNNLSLFIDDKGYMQNTIVGPNGEISQNPKDFQSVNNLYVTMNDRDDAYDVIGQVSKRVTPLGDYIRAKRSQGVLTLKDIMQNPEYIKAENDIIASMMSNDVQLGSILADFDDTYDYTFSEEEAKNNPNLILLKQNGMGTQIPQATEEQRKVAEELLRAQIRVQLDRIETPMPVQQEQQWQYQRGQEQRREQQNVGMWHSLAFGTASEQNTAANQLLGSQKAQELGLVKIEPSGTTVKLTYDGSGSMGAGTRTFDASGKTAREWAAIGNELHGVDDVNRALTAAGVSNPSQVFAGSLQGTSAERTRTNIMQDVPVYVESNLADITAEEFKNNSEGNMAAKLETALGGLGFTLDTDWVDDAVTITAPSVDGKPGASMTFTVDASEGNSENRQAIIDFVTANITPETVAKLKSSGRLNVSSQNSATQGINTAVYNTNN